MAENVWVIGVSIGGAELGLTMELAEVGSVCGSPSVESGLGL